MFSFEERGTLLQKGYITFTILFIKRIYMCKGGSPWTNERHIPMGKGLDSRGHSHSFMEIWAEHQAHTHTINLSS